MTIIDDPALPPHRLGPAVAGITCDATYGGNSR